MGEGTVRATQQLLFENPDFSTTWASDRPGVKTEWLEFTGPPGEDEEHPRRYRVNVSFMLSYYSCIFGQGCPSVMLTGVSEHGGCCQIGVHLEADEFDHVKSQVEQLTAEDADNFASIQERWWYYEKKKAERKQGYTRHTVVMNGGCIFLNRAGGSSTGKPGCAFHVLAERKGLHHSDTKPDICWQIPLAVVDEWDEDDEFTTVTISATPGRMWGSTGYSDTDYPGWWCTETPDAYNGKDVVYVTHEVELRKILGDEAYELMATYLDNIWDTRGRKEVVMPGESINGARPLIPLMVANRIKAWHKEGKEEQLQQSKEYLRNHPEVVAELSKASLGKN